MTALANEDAPRVARDGAARYTRTAVVLHWSVAALVLMQIALGVFMQTIAKVPVGPRVDAYNLHKSMGMAVLALMVVRIGWRILHAPPPLPPMPRWQRAAAHGSHALLYAALVAQPLIGFAGSVASGYPVRLFGHTLPPLWPRDDALKDGLSTAHLVVAIVLVAAIALHVAAAVRHAFGRDGVLQRMLPGRG